MRKRAGEPLSSVLLFRKNFSLAKRPAEDNAGCFDVMIGKFGYRKEGNATMRKPSLAQKDVLNPEEAIEYFGFGRRIR